MEKKQDKFLPLNFYDFGVILVVNKWKQFKMTIKMGGP